MVYPVWLGVADIVQTEMVLQGFTTDRKGLVVPAD